MIDIKSPGNEFFDVRFMFSKSRNSHGINSGEFSWILYFFGTDQTP